jgi:hypothetical protein
MYNRISNYKMSTISIAIVAAILISRRPPPSNSNSNQNLIPDTQKFPVYIRTYH